MIDVLSDFKNYPLVIGPVHCDAELPVYTYSMEVTTEHRDSIAVQPPRYPFYSCVEREVMQIKSVTQGHNELCAHVACRTRDLRIGDPMLYTYCHEPPPPWTVE